MRLPQLGIRQLKKIVQQKVALAALGMRWHLPGETWFWQLPQLRVVFPHSALVQTCFPCHPLLSNEDGNWSSLARDFSSCEWLSETNFAFFFFLLLPFLHLVKNSGHLSWVFELNVCPPTQSVSNHFTLGICYYGWVFKWWATAASAPRDVSGATQTCSMQFIVRCIVRVQKERT